MRFRLPIFLILLVFSFLILPISIFASGFQLKTVGGLNVEGAILNQLWYTNGNVTFTGIALANSQVTTIIDGTSATITVDSSGNWSYPASLLTGDHQVSFTSNESTITFTLTIGTPPADIGSLQTAETPTVGVISPTIIMLLSGILLIFSPFFLKEVHFWV